MSKSIRLIICAFLLFSITLTNNSIKSYAEQEKIKVVLNEKQLTFDIQPQLVNNRVLLPMRAIFEALGATIEWDGETRTVTGIKNGIKVVLTIGSSTAYVNNKEILLDVSASLINSRTMVPVRFLAESLGAIVEWDDSLKTVIIKTTPTPDATPLSLDEVKYIVGGVSKISVSYPGGIEITSDEWIPIVSADSSSVPNIFAAVRKYGKGRVLSLGKEEILNSNNIYILDNLTFLKNSIRWLNVSGNKRLGYSIGHSEHVNRASVANLKKEMEIDGYVVNSTSLTASALKNVDVLIIGNAWGSFTDSEISCVENFVNNGGGLILAGLGWSFDTAHPNTNYPMNIISSSFGTKWGKNVISDTREKYKGSPVFNIFYPDIETKGDKLSEAIDYITKKTAEHPEDLIQSLESDSAFKSKYIKAHLLLAAEVIQADRKSNSRQKVYDFCLNMEKQYPQYYSKRPTFDIRKYPTITWLRERFINTWISSLELTDAVKQEIARAGNFSDKYLEIWNEFTVYIADNNSLDEAQKQYLFDVLKYIPSPLHNIRIIAVENYIQPDLKDISYAGFAIQGSDSAQPDLEPGWKLSKTMMHGVSSSVNIYHKKISDILENAFPVEVSPGIVSFYCGVVSHEINHIVDSYAIYNNPILQKRRDQLLKAAGNDSSNYIRSMFGNGFFTENPAEFFASIANSWFADSSKTLALGLKRFDEGSKHPINQVLFFAEVYSKGGDSTSFYYTDTAGNISRTTVPVSRDKNGRIYSLIFRGKTYLFDLDVNGDVLNYSILEK